MKGRYVRTRSCFLPCLSDIDTLDRLGCTVYKLQPSMLRLEEGGEGAGTGLLLAGCMLQSSRMQYTMLLLLSILAPS